MTQTGIYEENRLFGLLRSFSEQLALDYFGKLRMVLQKASAADVDRDLEFVRDKSLSDPLSARIRFQEPLLLLLSHPICRMRFSTRYAIQYEWERFYVAKLGILPVYLVNMNTISVVKLWAERAEQTDDQILRLVLQPEEILLEMRVPEEGVDKPPRYSTMNLVIPFAGGMFKSPDKLQELCRRYLDFTYWTDMKPGFTFSTHFIHSRESIDYVVKVAKNLCLIDELGKSTRVRISERILPVREAKVRVMSGDLRSQEFRRMFVFVPEDVIAKLTEMEAKNFFLNACILEIKQKGGRPSELLSVLCDIGSSSFDLAQTIIGYALMTRYNQNEFAAYCSTIDELRADYDNLFREIWHHAKLPTTVSDSVPNLFDMALQSHYPIFVLSDGKLYFLHPVLLSFLYANKALDLIAKDNKASLVQLFGFIERIGTEKDYIRLYLDPLLDLFHGKSKQRFIQELATARRKILFSKIMKNTF